MVNIFPIVFIIAFSALWVTVSLLLSHMGGWSRLARCYPDDITAKNELTKASYLQSGSVGLVNYNSCLILGVSKSGLRLSVLFPFRIAHPPLFIPWSEFRDITEKRTLFLSFLVANIGMPVVTSVMLPLWIRDYIPSAPANRSLFSPVQPDCRSKHLVRGRECDKSRDQTAVTVSKSAQV